MDAPTTSKGDTESILLEDSFLDVDLIEVDDLINSATRLLDEVYSTRPMPAPSASSEREDAMQQVQRFLNSIREPEVNEEDDVVFVAARPGNALPSNARTTAVVDLCSPATADEGTPNSSSTQTLRRRGNCSIVPVAFPQLTDSNIPVKTRRRQPKKEPNTGGKTTKVGTPPTSPTTAANTTGSPPQGGRLPSLMCAVCMESVINRQPSSTSCGHIFCQKCIMQAIKLTKKCPLCNCKLTRTQVHRVYF